MLMKAKTLRLWLETIRGFPQSVLFCVLIALGAAADAGVTPLAPSERNPDRIKAPTFAQGPLVFENNRGQASLPPRVKFFVRGAAGNLFLTADEMVLQFRRADRAVAEQGVLGGRYGLERTLAQAGQAIVQDQPDSVSLTVRLAGANPEATLEGRGASAARVNYFLGPDAAAWRAGIPTYNRVQCRQVYPGIDLVYYGNQGQVEYDFVVAPGADPARIAFVMEGATSLTLNTQGDLLVGTPGGQIRQHRPVVYQELDGQRQSVGGRYRLEAGSSSVRMEGDAYDKSRPLVIDPVLTYSTFFGGAGDDQAFGVAVDKAGFIYIVGQTSSLDFPTAKPVQPKGAGDYDVFVAKFDPTGGTLVYSTFLGGSAVERGFNIAVDNQGSAYVVGVTFSKNFPVTPNAFQPKFGGGDRDGFVAKLNPEGSALVFASYVGGSASDEIACVALDPEGNAYLGGDTSSTNFPALKALQKTNRGGFDAVALKMNPDGALQYSTYLGGSGPYDCAIGMAVDLDGNAYLAGYTSSADFPTVNPLQTVLKGGYDGFVAKLNSTGVGLAYSTFLGGAKDDVCRSISVDKAGSIYVSGDTFSTDFPIKNAVQKTNAGRRDVFVTKLAPAGASLVFSTYFGGSGEELAGLALDRTGSVCLVGLTTSTNLTTIHSFQDHFGGGTWDAFVAKFSLADSNLIYASYLGGKGNDQGAAITLSPAGDLILVGATASPDFPTVRPFQPQLGGGSYDAFLARLGEAAVAPVAAVVKATPEPETTNAAPPITVTAATNIVATNVTVEPAPVVETPKLTLAPPVRPDTNVVSGVVTNELPATKAIAQAATNELATNLIVTVPAPEATLTNAPAVEPKPTEPEPAQPKPVEAKVPEPKPIEPKAAVEPKPVEAKAIVETNSVAASLLATNLIVNGGAEAGAASASSYGVVPIPGWTVTNKLTVLRYGMPGGFPSTSDPGPSERGRNFFVGGPDSALSIGTQVVDVAALSAAIDDSGIAFKLSGYLGGTSAQHDHAKVQLFFKTADGETLAQASIGPVTPSDRNFRTKLVSRSAAGDVPPKTRTIEIRLQMVRFEGTYNDAFADELSLVLQSAH